MSEPVHQPAILLVEDDAMIRETLAEILEMQGHAVKAVATAEQGLEELRRGRYALLLTDYDLPGELGTWLIQQGQAASLLGDTAVLLITAHPLNRLDVDVPVLRKPLDLDAFLDRIASVLPTPSARAAS